ncbi:sirohydrochlorin chelatase [Bacillus sp. MRMR6]|uniref:sirohydrochlorin chelatase n=1 Tax=Bacillus sp. MRMR6 TaxID=1928617 RepID=UPI00095127C9|nr:sirohydrochlorin chelatase [Bacillus sp. MRMR6]OLS40400.1 cobalamin biosynthesis protein CbiX [Bacillus sp. MRMR6]
MRAILYIGHGTRSKKGAEEAKAFIHKVMERVAVPIQEISFLELTDPLIEEGFRRCVEQGATEINVVPLFLLAAGHIKQDIPQALDALKTIYPSVRVNISDPFGVQAKILDAITEVVKEVVYNLVPQDRLLVVGRGSSDPATANDFTKIATGLKERLRVDDVSVCYLAAVEPRLHQGLDMVTAGALGRIIVVPYLLFSGLLIAEVTHEVRKLEKQGFQILHTGPLSSHRVFEEIVIERASVPGKE